jgi:hypothetical protein
LRLEKARAIALLLKNGSTLHHGGHIEVVRLLLEKWPSVTRRVYCSREEVLGSAAGRGYEAIARLILEKGLMQEKA